MKISLLPSSQFRVYLVWILCSPFILFRSWFCTGLYNFWRIILSQKRDLMMKKKRKVCQLLYFQFFQFFL